MAGRSGDFNNSGSVEQADLDLVLLNWGESATPIPTGWVNDLPTGLIDQEELDQVLLGWGNSMISNSTTIPEPCSVAIGLLILAIAGCRIARHEA